MKMDVNLDFKRSLLAGIGMVCATVALCLKAIEVTVWSGFMVTFGGSYFIARTKEESAERKIRKVGNIDVDSKK